MAYSNLKNGSSGSDVKKLQQELINAGYNVGKTGADGIYGANTAAAVKQYQKDHGLTVDGIAGKNTQGSIYGGVVGVNLATGNKKVNEKVNIDGGTAGDKTKKENLPELPESSNDGQTTSTGTATSVPSFVDQANALLQQYNASRPTYTSQWDAQIKEYLDKIMNREKFNYNFNEDALYQMYKDQYIQQGQMAMMDTMGQAAAMTGGYGNSYAQTVGQQAYNQQLSELNNIIPELYQMAFDQYAYEGDQLYNQYGLLMDQENMDYGRYIDKYNMWDSDRNFEYGVMTDGYDRAWEQYVYNNNMEYQQGRDQVSDQQWQTTFDEGVRQYEEGKTTGNSGNSGNGGNNNDTTTKYADFGYEEQAKWDKEFQRADSLYAVERIADRMQQAGIDPKIVAEWYKYYAEQFMDDEPDKPATSNVGTGGGGGGGTMYAMPW